MHCIQWYGPHREKTSVFGLIDVLSHTRSQAVNIAEVALLERFVTSKELHKLEIFQLSWLSSFLLIYVVSPQQHWNQVTVDEQPEIVEALYIRAGFHLAKIFFCQCTRTQSRPGLGDATKSMHDETLRASGDRKKRLALGDTRPNEVSPKRNHDLENDC
jgi:hypothetical protein